MEGHSKGIHTIRTNVSRLLPKTGWGIGMVFLAPAPLSVLDLFIKGLEFRITMATCLVILFGFLHSTSQKYHTFNRRFKSITNSEQSCFTVCLRVSVDELDDDFAHKSSAFFGL